MINVNPHNPRPGPSHDNPLHLRSAADLFELARQDPTLRASVFESDWAAIDRDRTRAARAGLADRLTFHHTLAFFCPLVRAALARTRPVVIDDP